MGLRFCQAVGGVRALRAFAVLMALVLAPALAQRAMAHEGHDLGAPRRRPSLPPSRHGSMHHRQRFELIAVYRINALTIFVDRFVTNEPVTGANVEVDTPKGSATARENPDGTYSVPAEWAVAGGSYDMIFTVTAGTDIDVLTGTLKLPGVQTSAQVVVKTSWLSLPRWRAGSASGYRILRPDASGRRHDRLLGWNARDAPPPQRTFGSIVCSAGALALALAVGDARAQTAPANSVRAVPISYRSCPAIPRWRGLRAEGDAAHSRGPHDHGEA